MTKPKSRTTGRRVGDYCPGCDQLWDDCTCKLPSDIAEQRDAVLGDLGLPPDSVVQAAP